MNSPDTKKEDLNSRSEKITRPDLARNITAAREPEPEQEPETTRYSSGGQIDVIISSGIRSGIQGVFKRKPAAPATVPACAVTPAPVENSSILPSAKKSFDGRAYRKTLPSLTAIISPKKKEKEIAPPHIQALAVKLRAMQKKGFKNLTQPEQEEFLGIAEKIRVYLESKTDK